MGDMITLHPLFLFPTPPPALYICSCFSERFNQISRQGQLTHFLIPSQGQEPEGTGFWPQNPQP